MLHGNDLTSSPTKDLSVTQIKHMTGQGPQAQTFPSCIYSGYSALSPLGKQGPLTPFEIIIELSLYSNP